MSCIDPCGIQNVLVETLICRINSQAVAKLKIRSLWGKKESKALKNNIHKGVKYIVMEEDLTEWWVQNAVYRSCIIEMYI